MTYPKSCEGSSSTVPPLSFQPTSTTAWLIRPAAGFTGIENTARVVLEQLLGTNCNRNRSIGVNGLFDCVGAGDGGLGPDISPVSETYRDGRMSLCRRHRSRYRDLRQRGQPRGRCYPARTCPCGSRAQTNLRSAVPATRLQETRYCSERSTVPPPCKRI